MSGEEAFSDTVAQFTAGARCGGESRPGASQSPPRGYFVLRFPSPRTRPEAAVVTLSLRSCRATPQSSGGVILLCRAGELQMHFHRHPVMRVCADAPDLLGDERRFEKGTQGRGVLRATCAADGCRVLGKAKRGSRRVDRSFAAQNTRFFPAAVRELHDDVGHLRRTPVGESGKASMRLSLRLNGNASQRSTFE